MAKTLLKCELYRNPLLAEAHFDHFLQGCAAPLARGLVLGTGRSATAAPAQAMMVPTHLAAGLCAGAAAVVWLQVPALQATWVMLGALLGALLPDIDHPKSWLGRRLLFISLPLATVFGHRGITHSLVAVAGVCWAQYQALLHWSLGEHWRMAAVGVGVGYLSHLLGDFATHGGVPWLWPYKQRFSLPLTFRTGSWFERLLFFALWAGTLYLLMLHFAPWMLDDAWTLWHWAVAQVV